MSVPQNNSLGLQPPSSSAKLSPTIQNKSTGSATGNPRNKCALKPGHSLMDWIRLGNSGCDLSGTKGAVIPVSSKALAKHCTTNDAWMAIRGNVYNVTRYMDFHPGGADELMRGVGKDATKLFDEVHAWVNYEQLLKKCLIGPLRNIVTIDADFLKPLQIKAPSLKPPIASQQIPTKVKPRFDWIQKQTEITIYFYTKQFCNPGLILKRIGDKNIEFRICIANCWHRMELNLHQEINWPPTNVKVSSESGKIEICFSKTQPNVWPGYGTLNESTEDLLEDTWFEFEILENQSFNRDSFELRLRGKENTIILVPVGYHLSFRCKINDSEVSRKYTPIPKEFSVINSDYPTDLYFLLKTYDKGLVPNHIQNLPLNSSLSVSLPKGSIMLEKFLGHTKIALLAAGSGITPMLSLTTHLLSRKSSIIEKLTLLFFNKTEEDIWCRRILQKQIDSEDRFEVVYILSKPEDNWNGHKGHISKELLSNICNPSSLKQCTFFCCCGPTSFNNITEQILKTLDVSVTNMYFFQG